MGTTDFPAPPADGRILFFKRDREAFGFLSHFHPSPIVLDGETWPTVEHWYQTQKSFDPRYRAAVRAAPTPGKAKQLASVPLPPKPDRGSWFLANGEAPRSDWYMVKADLMRRADTAKYTQNPELAARLLATGTAEIVEDSPYDDFWGVGADGQGANWAGRILMEVRETLRAEQSSRQVRAQGLSWARGLQRLAGTVLAVAVSLISIAYVALGVVYWAGPAIGGGCVLTVKTRIHQHHESASAAAIALLTWPSDALRVRREADRRGVSVDQIRHERLCGQD
jgi:ribA/ribD-fused uncharacterized protein